MPLSSHCKQHHYKSMDLLASPDGSSILPDGRFLLFCKYLDKIQHPDTHASDSENPDHCNLLPDNRFYPDKSLHLKMYSKNLLPVLQMDLLKENLWIRKVHCVPECVQHRCCSLAEYEKRC